MVVCGSLNTGKCLPYQKSVSNQYNCFFFRKLQHTTSLTLDAETSRYRRNNFANINRYFGRNISSNNNSSKFKTPLPTDNATMTDDILENNFVNEEDCCAPTKYNETLFFTDGVRSIDFVLAYKVDPDPSQEALNAHKRFKYEANLLQHGLQMEVDYKEQQHIHFVKVSKEKIYVCI